MRLRRNGFRLQASYCLCLACSLWLAAGSLLMSCQPSTSVKEEMTSVKLLTVDPGHFHAALVQKSMYDGVDSVVHVYAPAGPDVQLHLGRIGAFNARAESPTHWKEEVYTGDDFFQKMLTEKAGNVVVLSGNNQKKTEYIAKSLEAGFMFWPTSQ